MIGRALVHGRRRAEEMREVARTVADAGIEPLLSSAIAQRQDWAADRGAAMGGRLAGDLPGLLDSIVDRPEAAE
jgi:3-hydroxyisobutyrate dehydrogenase